MDDYDDVVAASPGRQAVLAAQASLWSASNMQRSAQELRGYTHSTPARSSSKRHTKKGSSSFSKSNSHSHTTKPKSNHTVPFHYQYGKPGGRPEYPEGRTENTSMAPSSSKVVKKIDDDLSLSFESDSSMDSEEYAAMMDYMVNTELDGDFQNVQELLSALGTGQEHRAMQRHAEDLETEEPWIHVTTSTSRSQKKKNLNKSREASRSSTPSSSAFNTPKNNSASKSQQSSSRRSTPKNSHGRDSSSRSQRNSPFSTPESRGGNSKRSSFSPTSISALQLKQRYSTLAFVVAVDPASKLVEDDSIIIIPHSSVVEAATHESALVNGPEHHLVVMLEQSASAEEAQDGSTEQEASQDNEASQGNATNGMEWESNEVQTTTETEFHASRGAMSIENNNDDQHSDEENDDTDDSDDDDGEDEESEEDEEEVFMEGEFDGSEDDFEAEMVHFGDDLSDISMSSGEIMMETGIRFHHSMSSDSDEESDESDEAQPTANNASGRQPVSAAGNTSGSLRNVDKHDTRGLQRGSKAKSLPTEEFRPSKKMSKAEKKQKKKRDRDSVSFENRELETWNDIIRDFIRDSTIGASMPFSPMGRLQRKQLHWLSEFYGLKSQSFGSGTRRSTSVFISKRTVLPDGAQSVAAVHGITQGVHPFTVSTQDLAAINKFAAKFNNSYYNEDDDDEDSDSEINVIGYKRAKKGTKRRQREVGRQSRKTKKHSNLTGSPLVKQRQPATQSNRKRGRTRRNTDMEEEESHHGLSFEGSSKPKQLVGAGAEEIPQSNLGHALLRRLGWSGGGLGKDQQGIAAPIEAVIKQNRRGLGS